MTLKEDIALIAELDAKRTQGEWYVQHDRPDEQGDIGYCRISGGNPCRSLSKEGYYSHLLLTGWIGEENGKFIAAAPLMACTIAVLAAENAEQAHIINIAADNVRENTQLKIVIAEQARRLKLAEGGLDDAIEFLAGQIDVLDGAEGHPIPNRAMGLDHELQAVLAEIRKDAI